MADTCSFKIVPYQSWEYSQGLALREEILRKPLGQSFSPEELALEARHIHVVGFVGDTLCATAVLVPEGHVFKMQRVAVDQAYQGQGIGGGLLTFCEGHVKDLGGTGIYCHARNTAVRFYSNNQYVRMGDYFDEDGIPHLKMMKTLTR